VEQIIHIPVMLEEVLEHLNLGPGKIVVDGTLGTAGHSLKILEIILPGGRLIGLDRDQKAIESAQERLKNFSDSCDLVHSSFMDMDKALSQLEIKSVDGILLDLGISSVQLDDPERGFTFQVDGPLDMRLDQNSYISAYDLVNNLNEDELSELLWNYGQERWHRRIARFLVEERQKDPISTTQRLRDIVVRATPHKYRYQRIHPATRTFQAIRIAVNRELEILEASIEKAIKLLNKGGRICIISFHSLEDRIVKVGFKNFAGQGLIKIITPKPLEPSDSEVSLNPRSRSAKLRVAERL